MGKIDFYKLQASGNDFILIDVTARDRKFSPKKEQLLSENLSCKKIAKIYCQRKFGIGADGLLVIEPSKKVPFKMRIFNPNGSEAEMCGNGARCVSLWANRKLGPKAREGKNILFATKAGIIEAEVRRQRPKGVPSGVEGKTEGRNRRNWEKIRVKTTDPFDLKLDLHLKILGRRIKVNFINTGVPHAVIFVEGLDIIDVENIGRAIRFHKEFSPAGTNVDFVEFLKDDYIRIRTYERGVEAETLACGTGIVASAIISNYQLFPEGKQIAGRRVKIKVAAKSEEILNVCFRREENKISDLWLEGKAYLVYKGEIEV